MNRTIEALQTVLPVLIMLGIGMLCRSRKLISREGVNALKSVVVNITLPAVLLSAFATTRYTPMDIVIPLLMFLLCLAAWLLGCLLSALIYRKGGWKKKQVEPLERELARAAAESAAE